jgi:2-polyprenyl-6-methoxyphenol hydroxylase-like FAD-dependent oxidoreductase
MVDVVIAGAAVGLMLACELGLAGIRPVVMDPMPGPNLQARVANARSPSFRPIEREMAPARMDR